MLRIFFNKFFDPLLQRLLRFRYYENTLKRYLDNEVNIGKTIDNHHRIVHLSRLLELNHQRVSASISHISIMIAVLLFSFQYIFQANKIPRMIISLEIVLYLLLTVALLRCLRDFGLDEDYTVETYDESFLTEIAFRFAILRVCNATIIAVTLVFALLLIIHFLAFLY
jgi:hypothetical protein